MELPPVEYWKKKFLEKWKSGKLKTRKFFSEIFKSKFSILHYSQNRKLGFKNFGKKFSEFSEISEFLAGKAILNDLRMIIT